MMTPKFTDVVDYVKGGEDDPEMRELLEQHPDGTELLKQARFIARMLKLAADESGRRGSAARTHVAAASLMKPTPIHAMRSYVASSDMMSRELSESPDSFFGDRKPKEDLGTLEFTIEGERVSLSYAPSKAAMKFAGKPRPKFELSESGGERIEIRGPGITLSLPNTISAGEALPLRLSHGARQMPAVGREMIFMPESGPFVRFRTDKGGEAQLPVPEESGTLRIDAGVTQVLHIRVKK